jgi:hypothetical protein
MMPANRVDCPDNDRACVRRASHNDTGEMRSSVSYCSRVLHGPLHHSEIKNRCCSPSSTTHVNRPVI